MHTDFISRTTNLHHMYGQMAQSELNTVYDIILTVIYDRKFNQHWQINKYNNSSPCKGNKNLTHDDTAPNSALNDFCRFQFAMIHIALRHGYKLESQH